MKRVEKCDDPLTLYAGYGMPRMCVRERGHDEEHEDERGLRWYYEGPFVYTAR